MNTLLRRRMAENNSQLASLTRQRDEDEDAKKELREKIRALQDTVSDLETEKDAGDRKISEVLIC